MSYNKVPNKIVHRKKGANLWQEKEKITES